VTVTGTASNCTPAHEYPPGSGASAPWQGIDAGADGSIQWSGMCHGALPDPDGGECAWRWLPDGAADWAPCDGGQLCAWTEADGGQIPGPCPEPLDAGPPDSPPDEGTPDEGTVAHPGDDAGSPGGTQPSPKPAAPGEAQPGGGSGSSSGGCSTAPGTTAASLTPLVAIGLVFGLRARRKRASGRAR
jgi:MYXO-CTERM domain-containing protein